MRQFTKRVTSLSENWASGLIYRTSAFLLLIFFWNEIQVETYFFLAGVAAAPGFGRLVPYKLRP